MRFLLTLIGVTLMLLAYPRELDLYKMGDAKGHTLMVFGGIHGNEPGGFFAPAMLASHYQITKGSLWVIPNINHKSITKFHRGIDGDMNRKFSTVDPKDRDYATVQVLKSLIDNPNVDLILNLHDGHGFYRDTYLDTSFNPGAWGQSCVIDQMTMEDTNSTFGSLSDIAQQVSTILNNGLLKEHHYFHVKNTKTRYKNEAMQQSLTYYAVRKNKPAFAIETSKNITVLADKVLYQLRAIEAFMQIMGIEFTRDFEMDITSIERILSEYGTVRINENITLDLRDISPILRYVPMKESENLFKFTHPLADYVNQGSHYEIYIGHIRVTSLFAQRFEMDDSLQAIDVTVDGTKSQAPLPVTLTIAREVAINAPQGYRVNIIGYTSKEHVDENNLNVKLDEMDKRYAIDKSRTQYRAEIYNGEKFCGMMVLDFSPSSR
ncbi:MAG: hypothetical protein KU37_08870 [Sulfuricurvum sp. PC08-66]|nr:MAG: hypothetical protein KU37_08870 [Sulfuricurvum sp. PC08-66]